MASFTKDVFSRCVPVWTELLASWKGRADLRYLEIGVYEGGSLIWMLDNILTHPTARATAVDGFFDHYEARFRSNLESSGWASKTDVVKGRAPQALRGLSLGSFDIIYNDACILPDDIMSSAVLSWDLLREGGLLIFDDYLWSDGGASDEFRPRPALDAFLRLFGGGLEVVHKDYQLAVRKKRNARKEAFQKVLWAGPQSQWKRPSS